jgi:uncharacterized protein YndB with AHSA1/START domain
MTARTITPAPVRRTIRVKAPPARAFDVFTGGMGRWWPREHSINKGSPQQAVILEPRAGGRWYERGEDGSECQWGRVLAWEPPSRVLLAWQVNGHWQYDPHFETEVEVNFIPDGTGTRVELEHRHLERFGDQLETVRAAFESLDGWNGLLARFAAVADG